MVGNRWLQTPKFEALEEILNQHSATLRTLSDKMDKVVGDQELTVVRQESIEKAHLEVEQKSTDFLPS